jgi:putative membrane protein
MDDIIHILSVKGWIMEQKKPIPLLEWILLVIKGMVVGAGAILPGISGGVLCVVFGIYQPMMALLAHPIKSFKIYYKLFIPFLIGWLIGFLALAKLLEMLFAASSSIAIALFVGLIAGTLPSLFIEAAKNGSTKGSWIGFALGLFIMFIVLSLLNRQVASTISLNIWWYAFCGIVWGFSLIVPGLSSSSILIFMGLYQPMTSGIASLDMLVILPLIAGLSITVISFARLVNMLFEKQHSIMHHTILGIVIASTLLIIPTEYSSPLNLAISIACFGAGFLISILMDKLENKTTI